MYCILFETSFPLSFQMKAPKGYSVKDYFEHICDISIYEFIIVWFGPLCRECSRNFCALSANEVCPRCECVCGWGCCACVCVSVKISLSISAGPAYCITQPPNRPTTHPPPNFTSPMWLRSNPFDSRSKLQRHTSGDIVTPHRPGNTHTLAHTHPHTHAN